MIKIVKSTDRFRARQFDVDLVESSVRMGAAIVSVLSFIVWWWASAQISPLRLIYDILFSFFVLLVVLAYVMGPRISLWRFKSFPYGSKDSISTTLKEVCTMHGLDSKPRLFLSRSADLPKPCCILGNSRKNTALVISEPLLDFLDEDDWRAVFAHEISHIKNKDMIFVTWGKTYLWMVRYWLVSFAILIVIYLVYSGTMLSVILDFGARFLIIAFLVVLLPGLIVNSVCRLREMLADARASLLIGTEKIRVALRQTVLAGYVINVIANEPKKVDYFRRSLRNILPSQIYSFVMAQYPHPKERIESLLLGKYTKRSFSAPSGETFFWIGLTTFLLMLGFVAPLFSFLLALKLVEPGAPEMELLFGGAPLVLLVFLSNLWLWRSESHIVWTDFEKKRGSLGKGLIKNFLLQSSVSVGTYMGLMFSISAIGGIWMGDYSFLSLGMLASYILLFLIFQLLSFIVSISLVILKVHQGRPNAKIQS